MYANVVRWDEVIPAALRRRGRRLDAPWPNVGTSLRASRIERSGSPVRPSAGDASGTWPVGLRKGVLRPKEQYDHYELRSVHFAMLADKLGRAPVPHYAYTLKQNASFSTASLKPHE